MLQDVPRCRWMSQIAMTLHSRRPLLVLQCYIEGFKGLFCAVFRHLVPFCVLQCDKLWRSFPLSLCALASNRVYSNHIWGFQNSEHDGIIFNMCRQLVETNCTFLGWSSADFRAHLQWFSIYQMTPQSPTLQLSLRKRNFPCARGTLADLESASTTFFPFAYIMHEGGTWQARHPETWVASQTFGFMDDGS